jgi:putative MFS transporter
LEIWRQPYLGRTIMLIVFNLFQAAGYYGFASWVPTLLISQGISVTTSLGYTFLIAIAAPFGPLAGLFFTEKVERKWIIVAASVAIAVFGLVFAVQRGMAGILVCGVALTFSNNILSFAYHGYQPELFPTRMRAAAASRRWAVPSSLPRCWSISARQAFLSSSPAVWAWSPW